MSLLCHVLVRDQHDKQPTAMPKIAPSGEGISNQLLVGASSTFDSRDIGSRLSGSLELWSRPQPATLPPPLQFDDFLEPRREDDQLAASARARKNWKRAKTAVERSLKTSRYRPAPKLGSNKADRWKATMSRVAVAVELRHVNHRGFFHVKGLYLLNPESRAYHSWWRLIVLLAYWNLFQVPFSVAFPPPEGSLMDYLVLVVDFIFFVDIFVVLSTPILIHGDECTSRKGIARNYAKLHLWIDLVACIPFSRIFQAIAPDGSPYMRLLLFNRVLRLRKLVLLLEKMSKNIMVNYEMIVILKLLTMVLVTTHTEACLFWFIGSVQHLEGRSSWLEDSGLEVGEDVWGNYVVSLYWSVVTYTTVGYGDICPANKAETAYAICVMIINMALTAYVLGNITMLTTRADQFVLEYRDSVSQVAGYLKRKKVDEKLVQMTLKQLETSQVMSEETDAALGHCAPYIRNAILSSLYNDQLSKCAPLQDTGREFIASIAHSSSMEFFQPDTVILRAKERAANFYFVLSGVLELFDWEDKSLRLLKKGQAFGCESVFCDMAQYYSVWSKSLVRVLVVSLNEMKAICRQYPADHRKVCANLLNLSRNTKSKHEFEQADITDMSSRIRACIQSLKTDVVTKLCYAASKGDIVAVKTILHSDPEHDINLGDYDGRRPVHVAAAMGSTEMLRYLLNTLRADPNVVDSFGGTPLLDAVNKGHAQAAMLLRSFGAELLLQNAGCLLCSTVMGGNTEMLRLFLENGADPNAADYDMRTPLHIACAEGIVPIVKMLLISGADINRMDRFGNTPVDEAEKSNNQLTVAKFINAVVERDISGSLKISMAKLKNMKSSGALA